MSEVERCSCGVFLTEAQYGEHLDGFNYYCKNPRHKRKVGDDE